MLAVHLAAHGGVVVVQTTLGIALARGSASSPAGRQADVGVAQAHWDSGWQEHPFEVPLSERDAGPDAATSAVPGPAVTTEAPTSPAPLSLEVPSVGIATSLVRLYLGPDGSLDGPESFVVAGWWAEGAEPGAVGPAVLVGHVDSYTGPAVFSRLDDVKVGATVRVTRSDRSVVTFVVDRARQVPKNQFPVEEVYGPTSGPQLRLITCGGRFDRRSGEYEDNLVVFAHLVAADAAGPPGSGRA